MCIYCYTYYTNCCHGELYRISYCEEAIALGLPERHDTLGGGPQKPDENTVNKPDLDPSSHNRSSASNNSRDLDKGSTSNNQHRTENLRLMSTTNSSDVAPARTWADLLANSDDGHPHGADFIPRSVQSDYDAPGHFGQPISQMHPLKSSQASSASEKNKLNINIPLDSYSGFSMHFTHEDGKVQQIVTRFETLAHSNGSHQLLSDNIRVHTGDARTRASSAATVRPFESDTDKDTTRDYHVSSRADGEMVSQATGFSISNAGQKHTHDRTWSEGTIGTNHLSYSQSQTLARKNAKSKGKAVGTSKDESDDLKVLNPRKPIPAAWTAKGNAPLLATAQRAKQHESRKKTCHTDSPVEAGRMKIRGTRSTRDFGKSHNADATTFLTKEAVAAVESDQTLTYSPSKLRRATSKATLESPTKSPVRNGGGRRPTITVTASPIKSPGRSPIKSTRGSISNFDGSGHSVVADTKKHARAPSSVSSVAGTSFVTAHTSPVSQVSRDSFDTALSQPCEDITPLDLADNAGDEQTVAKAGNTKTQSQQHARQKSEPYAIAPTKNAKKLIRPAIPNLPSLNTSHSGSAYTNRKSPLTLESASSLGSGTGISSRIPRSVAKTEPKASIATLKHSSSAKHLSSDGMSAIHHADVKGSRSREHDGTYKLEGTDPDTIPLPETPTAAPPHHTRTTNIEGITPTSSRTLLKVTEDTAVSPTEIGGDQGSNKTLGVSTTQTNNPPAQDPLEKHEIIQSYLEGTVKASPPESHGTSRRSNSTVTVLVVEASTDDNEPDTRIPTYNQSSRVISFASEATVKAKIAEEDPIMKDPAIMTIRRASGTIGLIPIKLSPIICMMAHSVEITGTSRLGSIQDEASSCKAESITVRKPPVSSCYDLSAEDRIQQSVPNIQEQAYSEYGLRNPPRPGLRADAAIFVPGQQAAEVPDQSNPAGEWTQLQQSPAFNPFELDVLFGMPVYHHMYPVAVGPGTPYDFRGFGWRTSPRKGKKKYNPNARTRGRKNRSESVSPIKASELDLLIAGPDNEDGNATPRGDVTPRAPLAIIARPQGADEAVNARITTFGEAPAFVSQLESIDHDAAVGVVARGRATRPSIDWSSIRNVPYHPRQQHGQTRFSQSSNTYGSTSDLTATGPTQPSGAHTNTPYGSNTLPPRYQPRSKLQDYMMREIDGYNRQSQDQSTYRPYSNRSAHFGGCGRGRNWNASTGVPLDETAPFPNPIPPTGPRRDENESNLQAEPKSQNTYTGYRVPNNKTCGHIVIADAKEHVGGVCHKCDAGH